MSAPNGGGNSGGDDEKHSIPMDMVRDALDIAAWELEQAGFDGSDDDD